MLGLKLLSIFLALVLLTRAESIAGRNAVISEAPSAVERIVLLNDAQPNVNLLQPPPGVMSGDEVISVDTSDILSACVLDNAMSPTKPRMLKRRIQLHEEVQRESQVHILTKRASDTGTTSTSSDSDSLFGNKTNMTIFIAVLATVNAVILLGFSFGLFLFIRHRRQRRAQPPLRDFLISSISHPQGSFARRQSAYPYPSYPTFPRQAKVIDDDASSCSSYPPTPKSFISMH